MGRYFHNAERDKKKKKRYQLRIFYLVEPPLRTNVEEEGFRPSCEVGGGGQGQAALADALVSKAAAPALPVSGPLQCPVF